MSNSASVSGSTGYNIPINLLNGGEAAPSSAQSTFGAVSFLDGAFQVGGAGNSAFTPESVSAPTMPQGYRSPADLSSYRTLGAASSSGGLSTTWLLIIGGLAAAAFFFLRHR